MDSEAPWARGAELDILAGEATTARSIVARGSSRRRHATQRCRYTHRPDDGRRSEKYRWSWFRPLYRWGGSLLPIHDGQMHTLELSLQTRGTAWRIGGVPTRGLVSEAKTK